MSGFIAMCVAGSDDARRARLDRLAADAEAALAASPPDTEAASDRLDELVRWADTEWAGHPYRPVEVRFLALCRPSGLDDRTRQDLFYVAGRAAMALDLGHLEAAEREIRRMEQVGSVKSRET